MHWNDFISWSSIQFQECMSAIVIFKMHECKFVFCVWTKSNVLEIATSCNNVILKTSNGSQTFWRVRHEATINCTRERERRMLVFIFVGFENIPECYSERHFLLLRDVKHETSEKWGTRGGKHFFIFFFPFKQNNS